MHALSKRLIVAERLTLAVLMCGVISLALSDFVSPVYWSLLMLVSMFRLLRGPGFSLSEMQASAIGWVGFIWVGIELILGRAWIVAFTDFLLILAMAVAIEVPTPRNHLHRMLVGMFLVLGAAVLTDSVLYILPLAAFVWFVWRAAQCLYGMNVSGGELPMTDWRNEIRLMPWIGLLVLLMFITFPRFDFQTYLKPTQPKKVTSGFTNEVNLGDFARELNPTVMMRVEPVKMSAIEFQRLMMGRYWRGTALSIYSGNGWQQAPVKTVRYWKRGDHARLSSQKGQEIALYREASDHPYVMLPDGVVSVEMITESMNMDASGSFQFSHAPTRRIRMLMKVGKQRGGVPNMAPPTDADLDIAHVSEAVSNWAEGTVIDAVSTEQRIAMLVGEMQGWSYDLNAAIDAERPVESFLNNRRGHCELYATLLALSLRSQRIPARVVNGYFGGEWNEVGGFYLIRQQHAHSWVEAWVDGEWHRYDSTPASRWSLTGVRFPAVDELWESIKLSWYRYILEFQNSDRGELFQNLIELVKRYLLAIAATLFMLVFLWFLIKQRQQRRLLMQGRWPVVDRWLEKHGVNRQPHQTLQFISKPEGVGSSEWYNFIVAWEQQRYGSAASWSRRDIRRHLRALSQDHC